jgi:hypothetical protein
VSSSRRQVAIVSEVKPGVEDIELIAGWSGPQCLPIEFKSEGGVGAGEGTIKPGSKRRANRVSLQLHSIQFDLPRSRIRSAGQENSLRVLVHSVRRIPVGVMPK